MISDYILYPHSLIENYRLIDLVDSLDDVTVKLVIEIVHNCWLYNLDNDSKKIIHFENIRRFPRFRDEVSDYFLHSIRVNETGAEFRVSRYPLPTTEHLPPVEPVEDF